MKLNKLFIVTGALALSLASCSKKYLDDPKPANGSLDASIIFGSKIGAVNALNGTYGLLRDYAYSGSPQNMSGIKNIFELNFEVKGNDIIADPSNWWLYEDAWTQNGYDRTASGFRSVNIWNIFYKAINNANAIILNVPNLPESQQDKDQLIAEARAIRALSYFNLARTYQFTYAKDPNAPGVPIYTTPANAASEGNPRAPLKDVYELIVSDLEYATATLPAVVGADKYRINKNVAHGLLARVYQEMAMADASLWDKAISNAKAAYAGYPLMAATEYVKGFNSRENVEWIWNSPFNATQQRNYAGFFGYIDQSSNNARYKCLYINDAFVKRFSASDVRNLFQAASGQSAANPWKKWVSMKFRDKPSPNYDGDYILMRSSEMYLIEAEGLAQKNQLELAKDKLFELQSKRDASATRSTAADKDELIAEILIERRKELYGEIGVEYFDLKRYQLPFVTEGNSYVTLNIPADDKRWVFQIPQLEVDANPKIEAADQNP